MQTRTVFKHLARRKGAMAVCAVILVFPTFFTATAATEYTWRGGGENSNWHNPDNWRTGGVQSATAPTNITDIAVFNTWSEEEFTVYFERSNTNGGLKIYHVNVVFDLQGHTNTLVMPPHNFNGNPGYLTIVNGEFQHLRDPGLTSNRELYIGNGGGARNALILRGPNARFWTNERVYAGYWKCDLGAFELYDGASAQMESTLYAGQFDGSSASTGRVVVSDSTLDANVVELGRGAGSYVEMIVTGTNAIWRTLKDHWPVQIIGLKGEAHLTVSDGARVPNGMQVFSVAQKPGSIGSITVIGEGSAIGAPSAEGGRCYTATIGIDGTGAISSQPQPEGGIGTLNLLDGGSLTGWTVTTARYFLIGAGSRVRIRDGSIKWCLEKDYRNPFFFRPGSFYTVELTDRTAELTETAPLIWSGANDITGVGTRMNIIDGAILELELAGSYEHKPGAVFDIFRYDGDLSGEFAGLPEGSDILVGGHRFKVSYGERSEDSIILTAMPPQGALLLIR